jgi:hypothetical protein
MINRRRHLWPPPRRSADKRQAYKTDQNEHDGKNSRSPASKMMRVSDFPTFEYRKSSFDQPFQSAQSKQEADH